MREDSSLSQAFLNALHNRNKSSAFQLAEQMVEGGRYEEAIQAYQSLMESYPEDRAFFENQVGRIYAKMDDFEKALKYFVAARVHSFDADVVEEEVFALCLREFQKQLAAPLRRQILQRYLILYPKGKHREEVENLLKKERESSDRQRRAGF